MSMKSPLSSAKDGLVIFHCRVGAYTAGSFLTGAIQACTEQIMVGHSSSRSHAATPQDAYISCSSPGRMFITLPKGNGYDRQVFGPIGEPAVHTHINSDYGTYRVFYGDVTGSDYHDPRTARLTGTQIELRWCSGTDAAGYALANPPSAMALSCSFAVLLRSTDRTS